MHTSTEDERTPPGRSFFHRHWPFLVVLAVTAIIRVNILILSQIHVQTDEAVVGLMAKRILEGRAYPFYFISHHYNAAAAWEAYLASLVFRVLGVGVVPLKVGVTILSLIWLTVLYRLADKLYGRRIALLSIAAFILCPTLLRWNFHARGYPFYILSVPVLALLFRNIDVSPGRNGWRALFFGLACGVSLWGLELILPFAAALWLLLALRGKLKGATGAMGVVGLVAGYAPTLIYNFTHDFANWREVFIYKATFTGWLELLRPSQWWIILSDEMPKYFGPDTLFFYFTDKKLVGYLFFAIAAVAVVVALVPLLKAPLAAVRAFRRPEPGSGIDPDLLMLLLIGASSISYLTIDMRTPNYFLGAAFFFPVLMGRLLDKTLFGQQLRLRLAGVVVSLLMLSFGLATMWDFARRNEIDMIVHTREGYQMAHLSGKDVEAVQRHLQRLGVDSVGTAFFLEGMFSFESGERLTTFDVGTQNRIWFPPGKDDVVFVLETESPYCEWVVEGAQAAGLKSVVTPHGNLTVIDVQQSK